VEGKPIRSFIAEKDKEWFNRIWEGLIKGGRHFEGYMKHITRTGKDLWTIATYTCMRDDDGEVTCILFLAIDSTAQKEISLNMEGVVDAVNRSSVRIEFDTSGNIKDFNDAFLYLFKYSEKDTQNLNINDIIHHLELEDFNKKWENIVNGMNFQGQFKVQTSSGEEKWIRGAFSAVFDMYSEVQKVIYIGQDITNEKLMEIEFKQQNETLRKQEKMLRESEKDLSRKLKEARIEMQNQFKEIEQIKIRNERTLEGALDTIITTSSKNEIIFYNQAAEKLLGYTKEEVMGKNISMLFTEEIIKDDEFVQKYTSEGTDKIVGVRKEISLSSKSGEELPVLILLSEAEVDEHYTYTAFIQTIEVELF
ncbi:MAG: PAS domain S-box protein, partial [Bacteroidales bacterium]|nr:PAS domain S-box protein [Bacteroidales bacterium]